MPKVAMPVWLVEAVPRNFQVLAVLIHGFASGVRAVRSGPLDSPVLFLGSLGFTQIGGQLDPVSGTPKDVPE